MRTVSLASRLQWSFRGTVLPGALATGDVDNDGCKEFVVGSVQGELAIFRGRGGCGTWRYSEEQIDPEYDCWDAVERGEFPSETIIGQLGNDSMPAIRRQSTYTSLIHSTASNRESLSVDDIMHMFDGGDRGFLPYAASADMSEDDTTGHDMGSAAAAAASGKGAKKFQLNPWDPEYTGHIKWEDALDLERDGRKPWILAQKLGTISSVVVADISNSGHNSIIVVNGEGKCHIFDYPFKRRLHPEMAKRKRQRNHYRRYSQDRFFKNGVVIDPLETDQGDHAANAEPRINGYGSSAAIASKSQNPTERQDATAPVAPVHSESGAASTLKRPPFLRSRSAFGESICAAASSIYAHPGERPKEGFTTNTHLATAAAAAAAAVANHDAAQTTADRLGHFGSSTNNEIPIASGSWKQKSSINTQAYDASQTGYLLPGSDMVVSASNVSSQADPPLTILEKRDGREFGTIAFQEPVDRAMGPVKVPTSPTVISSRQPAATVAAAAYSGQGGFSNGTNSSGRRKSHHQIQQHEQSDAGMDSLSAAFGDGEVDSDQDFADVLSDIGDNALLTNEEVADIEKIWGANIGKKSGDWFPFVLDQPDMTFSIPTNVEHALVADIDNNGLNELVLTATDGFVYVFRIEPSVKHVVKPTLSSVGIFSNNPTTLPSVNMTGNGSPYLYMSAPRSPDESDLDLNDSTRPYRLQSAARRAQRILAERQNATAPTLGQAAQMASAQIPSAPAPPAPANTVVPQETESDLDLVNHLIKSIKDVSAPPSASDKKTNDLVDRGDGSQAPTASPAVVAENTTLEQLTALQKEDLFAQQSPSPVSAQSASSSATTGRKQGSGRRMSLTSRMRENFTGIVSGWDTVRKAASSVNHTAPPSLNHSRVHTANNSGTSTNTHSRVPSIGEDGADTDQINTMLDSSASANAAASSSPPRSTTSVTQYNSANKGSVAVQLSPATVSSTGDSRVPRMRHGTMGVGALDVVEEIPERRSIDNDSNNGSPGNSLSKNDAAPTRSAESSKAGVDSDVAKLSGSDEHISPVSAGQLDPTSVSGLVDTLALHRRVGSSGSRLNSRTGSLVKAIGQGGSRTHSRHGSVSSVAKARVSSSATAASAVLPLVHVGSESEIGAESLNTAPSGINSRRTSIGSNPSARDDGTNNSSTAGQQAALPLEVAVSARGSFSKPTYHPPHPPRPTDAEDNNSVISQVTERLTELTKKTKGKTSVSGIAESPLAIAPLSRAKNGHTFYEPFEGDFAATQLPPSRNVVDWSTTTADKVATWFLDNIPGNVSVVNAPSRAFGPPLTQQRRDSDSDDFSDDSCSSCSCSECADGASSNESLDLAPERAGKPATALPKLTVVDSSNSQQQPAPSREAGSSAYIERNLPQPLGLDDISKKSVENANTVAENLTKESSQQLESEQTQQDTRINGSNNSIGIGNKDNEELEDENKTKSPFSSNLSGNSQMFLILSKPGGRFVPIDMVNSAMMATIEPPQMPLSMMTGGNTALMNVDAGGTMRNIQLAMSVGLAIPQLSGFEYSALSNSYMGQSSSWQSGSIQWTQAIPQTAESYGSGANVIKSPMGVQDAGPLLLSSRGERHASEESNIVASPPQIPSEPHVSTEQPLVSQFPSDGKSNVVTPRSLSTGAPQQELASIVGPVSASSSRQSQSSLVSNSFFNTGAGSGSASLTSNLRSMRSIQRLNSDGQRAQNFNAGYGPSPIYRGMSAGSSAITPMATGVSAASVYYERRHLGFAGLRGYIGNGLGRHRSGGMAGNTRAEDGSMLPGYFTPVTSGQASARGQSAGPISQGMGAGVMPREPLQGYSSSVSTTASISHVADRSARSRMDSARQLSHVQRNSPNATGVVPASPQRGQNPLRYSPSATGWSSYKDIGMLSTIRDQEGFIESEENLTSQYRLGQGGYAAVRSSGELLSGLSGSGMHTPALQTQESAVFSPYTDDLSSHSRGYWVNAGPASARSHSSLGTGVSASNVQASDEKEEEEIEEAPQPMELDVATYMVGGVAAGKRQRRLINVNSLPISASTKSTLSADDSDEEDDYELHELVSLVTMDGVISCYDPVRKVNHFVSLSSKDPVLGIWKVKMHDDISRLPTLLDVVRRSGDRANSARGQKLLSNTPGKRVYRRVGLSNHDLLYAVRYSTFIEDRVQLVNRLEMHRRRQARRQAKKVQPQSRNRYGGVSDEKIANVVSKRDTSPPVLSRSNTLSRVNKPGLNSRIRENLTKYHRVGRVVRNLGNHIRDFAASSGISTQQSTADSSMPLLYASSSHNGTDESVTVGIASDFTTPENAASPVNRRLSTHLRRDQRNQFPSQQSQPRRHHLHPHQQQQQVQHARQRLSCTSVGTGATSEGILYEKHANGAAVQKDSDTDDGDNEDAACENSEDGCSASDNNSSKGGCSDSSDDEDRGNGQQQQQPSEALGMASSGGNHTNSGHPTPALYHSSGYLGPSSGLGTNRLFGADISAALNGWYGENKNDYRRSLRVADHLVVSTWRGTTYFIDVSTLLDTAHYNDLFMYRWNKNVTAVSEKAIAGAEASEKNGSVHTEAHSCGLASLYGHLSEFDDLNGIMARLRANASVIQFKFQDTVSAFLADTYAPATGGPNVPCIFYVDYKDRVWVYYHLDEIAEMDDVYGATWLPGEPERVQTPSSRARAIESGISCMSHSKPLSVVDLAYRRINQEPWVPLIGDEIHKDLVSYRDNGYPYSSKIWKRRVGAGGGAAQDGELSGGQCLKQQQQQQQSQTAGVRGEESSLSPSETSTQAFINQANANITGRFHLSYIPGPYLCPIWADISSVDLYDVGCCNLLEVVSPELLAIKDEFCKDLGLDPGSVDENVNLVTVPGLAHWVRMRIRD
ncbi:hypothetical protein H4R99_003703 [Coemansia sp. RSA 1722]|nr:hypothetical protein H4R99_003703 [Coemansia sp. RSA 1722]